MADTHRLAVLRMWPTQTAYAAEETIQLLLHSGADKTIRDANGDSPQSWASWHWRKKGLIDLLDLRQ